MTKIDVTELGPSLEADYESFVASVPGSLIYSTLPFRDFLVDAVGGRPRYLVASSGGRLCGVMPTFWLSSASHGTVMNSLPWYGSHGGCVVAPGELGEAARRALLHEAAKLTSAEGVAFSTIVLTPCERAHEEAYRTALRPRTIDRRIGQVTELPHAGGDIEERLAGVLLQKTRNLARKSLKQGFELDESDDGGSWDFLHATHVENMRAIGGLPKPSSHFAALRRRIPPSLRRLLTVRLGGERVAALLLLSFNGTVEYLTPVIKVEHRPRQPLSFAIWHGMTESIRRGEREWNWGGTWESQRTLHHFKSGWGARDRPYPYMINASEVGLAALRADRASVAAAFGFYYLYPFSALEVST